MKLDVAKKIKGFCAGGGYLFAMCSGAETFDIALAAEGVDIIDYMYDGDDADEEAALDFNKTLAFENFILSLAQTENSLTSTPGGQISMSQVRDFFRLI